MKTKASHLNIGVRVAIMLVAVCSGALGADERPLLERTPSAAQIPARDAAVTVDAGVIRVATGHKEPWPGITLDAPGGRWDLSKDAALVAEIKNVGTEAVTVHMRVDNAGADGTNNCITREVTVGPGQTQSLRAALGRADIKLFGIRGYPPETYVGIDPARVTALVLFLNRPTSDYQWEVRSLRLEPAAERPSAFFPLIDTFGQYIHRDSPGKTHSLDELRSIGMRKPKTWPPTRDPRIGPLRWLEGRAGACGRGLLPCREGPRAMVDGGPGRKAVLFAGHRLRAGTGPDADRRT